MPRATTTLTCAASKWGSSPGGVSASPCVALRKASERRDQKEGHRQHGRPAGQGLRTQNVDWAERETPHEQRGCRERKRQREPADEPLTDEKPQRRRRTRVDVEDAIDMGAGQPPEDGGKKDGQKSEQRAGPPATNRKGLKSQALRERLCGAPPPRMSLMAVSSLSVSRTRQRSMTSLRRLRTVG